MMSFLASPSPRTAAMLGSAAGVAVISTYCLYCLYKAISTLPSSNFPQNIPSPRTTLLPRLSNAEAQNLPYPPDALPGARDVETPYGRIRAYEWGPMEGRKVMLIHGISTPCISLAGVAEKLAKQGCRVMLFDLFGRGYSSSPANSAHDIRLYTSQIVLVLVSSPLSWTGKSARHDTSDGFTLVGYSLGGCIATYFTATFPQLITNLVLIAPAGLIREKHVSWQSRLLYSGYGGLVPESWVQHIVATRLKGGPTGASAVSLKKSVSTAADDAATTSLVPPMAGEVPNTKSASTIHPSSASHSAPPASASFDNAVLFPDRPPVSVAAAVSWQLTHHQGFLPAFISCIRHCPIYGQHHIWRTIGSRLYGPREGMTGSSGEAKIHNEAKAGLKGRVLVVVGKTDPIIVADELREDGRRAIGEQNVDFLELEAGHEVPITRSTEIVEAMERMWKIS